jgi:hypothetical protein
LVLCILGPCPFCSHGLTDANGVGFFWEACAMTKYVTLVCVVFVLG